MEQSNSPVAGAITCSGCSLKIVSGKDYYRCKICPFFLHQVCYNMPRKTRHPGHPAHYLNLLVMPSSAKGSFKCKACAQNVTGFSYNCAECGIFYHILCFAVPLFIVINSHSHTLKLEFSLPYDFECDLCQEPGNKGWLYRCHLCEFDTHLVCAINNRRAQSTHHQLAPFPDPLTRQIVYSSASSLIETNGKMEYDSESNELMQLVAQGIRERMRQKPGAFQIKQDISAITPDPGESLEHQDHSSLLSADLSTLTSYQLSDSCFSIDIARSYSSYDPQQNQENNEAGNKNPEVVQDSKNKVMPRNDSMLDRITSNLEPGKQENNGAAGFSFQYKGSQINLLNEYSSQNKMNRENETRSDSGIKDQNPISERVSSILLLTLFTCINKALMTEISLSFSGKNMLFQALSVLLSSRI
ncbi:uncharacterized protein LOC116114506 [Pistacia vera]|uniref:uncharacterized protein LOC116114506 n=1 Tax=Pistacia vera TaxID=55513 RepID=UPI0012631807|nr:uncharacterized protein LOC116114506 [Pistacia vera]